MSKGVDYLLRALLPRPNVDETLEIHYLENGRPKVYTRRWFVLTAFCMCYFSWNFSGLRYTALISEFALFFDTTNEFSGFDELGIDFLTIFSSGVVVLLYPLGGQLVDSYGIGVMSLASVGMACASWLWFLAGTNYNLVLLSVLINNTSGCTIASCLLRLSHNWFPETERAMAVALGAFTSLLGAAAALLVGPAFSSGDPVINSALLSCDPQFLLDFNETANTDECSEEAEEKFCCAAPTDIEGYNLFVACMMTLVAIYTVSVTKDGPDTPPSRAGKARKPPKVKQALGRMYAHRNYMQICVADFLCSGPPLLIFATIDRIFPPSVTDYSTLAIAASFVLSIPTAIYFTLKLGQTKKFYEFTAGSYVIGCICFILVTIAFLIDSEPTDYVILFVACGALLCFIVWSVSVYELKMEYVFSGDFAIQGYVVAVDRTIINFSNLIFLAAIPPERYTGDLLSGRQFTALIGCCSFVVGTILVVTLPDKRKYLRLEYEAEEMNAHDAETKGVVGNADTEVAEVAIPEAEAVELKD